MNTFTHMHARALQFATTGTNASQRLRCQERAGESALIAASRKGRFGIVQYLLARGADVTSRDRVRLTVRNCSLLSASLTVSRCTLNHMVQYGRGALYAASFSAKPDLVRLLLEYGADVNAAHNVRQPNH